MNIIVRYIGLSWKKNFAYRINGFLVILDTMMDCFTLWLFWASLLELNLDLMGWTPEAIRLFLGYSLISSAVANLFVGAWDIGDHIPDGTLDTYLVRPCNPVLLILLERANFLRFAVTFPAGLVMVLRYGGSGHPALLLGGIALSILGTVLLQLLVLCIYILSFLVQEDGHLRGYFRERAFGLKVPTGVLRQEARPVPDLCAPGGLHGHHSHGAGGRADTPLVAARVPGAVGGLCAAGLRPLACGKEEV